MKPFPVFRPLALALLLGTGWPVAAVTAAEPPPPISFPFLLAELENMPSLGEKLQYVKAHAPADEHSKIAIAVTIIQSAPTAARGEAAARVMELLTRLAPRPGSSAEFAAAVVAALPENIAPSVAASVILGTARADPARLPQITVAVITSRQSTRRNAAAIAGAVVAASPVSQASAIAAALGSTFSMDRQLARSAPEIAAAITQGLLSKLSGLGASQAQVQRAIGESLAALTVLLPGSWQANRALIAQVERAVADVVLQSHPDMAAGIAGIAAGALKTAAGSSDISFVLNDLRNAFSRSGDPALQAAIEQAIAQALTGQGPEPVGEQGNLLSQNYMLPTYAGKAILSSSLTPSGGGNIAPPETNVFNP